MKINLWEKTQTNTINLDCELKGAISSTKFSGLSFENLLVANGSWRVRKASFHYTRKEFRACLN